MTRTAKLFMSGKSQAVRLPAEFRFEGKEVFIRRVSQTGDVILSKKKEKTGSWDEFFRIVDSLGPDDVPEDFMKDRDQGSQERDDIFSDFGSGSKD